MIRARRFIVVVDDDESVRDSLPSLLKMLGFDAVSFASAEAFLASNALDRADCLIFDVAMPGIGGLELVRQPLVRSAGVPVIFITALHDGDVRRELLNAGPVGCLLKPFSEDQILEALDIALDRGRH